MSNEQEVDQQQKDKQDAGKEHQKFEASKKKLIAILSGEDLLRPGKVEKDAVTKAMEALVKEKKEAQIIDLKKEVGALIDSYIAFNKFQAEKKKEFEKAVGDKMKEYNKQASAIFAKMEGIEQLEKDYAKALGAVGTTSVADEPTSTEDPE